MGAGYFKDWPESWLGPDGHYGLLFDGINVDGVHHRHKQLALFGQIRLVPQNGEFLQQLSRFHGGVSSGDDQVGQLALHHPMFSSSSPAITLVLISGTVRLSICSGISRFVRS